MLIGEIFSIFATFGEENYTTKQKNIMATKIETGEYNCLHNKLFSSLYFLF